MICQSVEAQSHFGALKEADLLPPRPTRERYNNDSQGRKAEVFYLGLSALSAPVASAYAGNISPDP